MNEVGFILFFVGFTLAIAGTWRLITWILTKLFIKEAEA